jgi:hypothetical protein
MRFFFVFGLLSVTAASQASYELALILDNDTAGGGVQVKRFDGDSGAYFGSFGAGAMTGCTSIASDGNTGTCLVGVSSGGIKRFDYSSGAYLGSPSSSSVRSLTFANGNFYGCLSSITNTLAKVNTLGVYSATTLPLVSSWSWVTSGVDGSLLACDQTNGDIWRTTSATPLAGSWTKIADLAAGFFSSSSSAVASYIWGSPQSNYEIVCLNNVNVLTWVDFNGAYTSLAGSGTYTMPPFTSVTAMAPAHYGVYHAGQTATGFQATRYDVLHSSMWSFGTSQLKGPLSMSVVLAPEPAVWMPVLAGISAIALMRRRTRL